MTFFPAVGRGNLSPLPAPHLALAIDQRGRFFRGRVYRLVHWQ